MSETNTETEVKVEEAKSAGKPTYKAQRLTTQEAQSKVEKSRMVAPNVDPLSAPNKFKK